MLKFDCGPTHAEKVRRLQGWHDWFAWYPVRIGPRECRWLEVVERVGFVYDKIHGGQAWEWTYRARSRA